MTLPTAVEIQAALGNAGHEASDIGAAFRIVGAQDARWDLLAQVFEMMLHTHTTPPSPSARYAPTIQLR